MSALIREAAIGQIIRYVTRNKFFKYPEEMPDFVVPDAYANPDTLLNPKTIPEESNAGSVSEAAAPTPALTPGAEPGNPVESTAEAEKADAEDEEGYGAIRAGPRNPANDTSDLEKAETQTEPLRISHTGPQGYPSSLGIRKTKTREETMPYTNERFEIDRIATLEREQTTPILPAVTNQGDILVDWYTTDDESNPQNWSLGKKNFATVILCIYTFVVYSGSAIYTSSYGGVISRFNVSVPVTSLGLSLYVLGYGMGPLLFSPLSEIARFGRNPTYVLTYGLFTILCVPTALVNNIGGLLFLRFLQGFFGSPCLATAPATMQDMFSFIKFPYALAVWTSFSFCGPAVGPILSGYAVPVLGWRWSLWEMLIMAGPTFVLMFLFMPETSADSILLRRAQRLRAITGDSRLKSASEIKAANVVFSAVVWDALIKPIQITVLDPAVLFVNVYTSFIYSTYYSFFEAFPVVFGEFYGMNLGEVSTTFLCILVACIIGVVVYISYLHWYLEPAIMRRGGIGAQESLLIPAMAAVFLPTIGLFLFAWTSRESIHWIVPIIGITLYASGVFVIFQCIFVYIPTSYPQYAASLFAGNDFCRSALACGSIMYARPLYSNLGIGRGVTVLAGLSTLGIMGIWALYFWGDKMRARSKFTVKQIDTQ